MKALFSLNPNTATPLLIIHRHYLLVKNVVENKPIWLVESKPPNAHTKINQFDWSSAQIEKSKANWLVERQQRDLRTLASISLLTWEMLTAVGPWSLDLPSGPQQMSVFSCQLMLQHTSVEQSELNFCVKEPPAWHVGSMDNNNHGSESTAG